ncbi:hypothetical protein CCR75_007718 [Bremia lactucae]|uniref:Uncharacterized protein n=1 Tax=Bremia lactucae TaxID=4779 RepID=A0A976IJ95_BRELC|nr:hypothetical protein CCR75_007718 [Bremia lactucae]
MKLATGLILAAISVHGACGGSPLYLRSSDVDTSASTGNANIANEKDTLGVNKSGDSREMNALIKNLTSLLGHDLGKDNALAPGSTLDDLSWLDESPSSDIKNDVAEKGGKGTTVTNGMGDADLSGSSDNFKSPASKKEASRDMYSKDISSPEQSSSLPLDKLSTDVLELDDCNSASDDDSATNDMLKPLRSDYDVSSKDSSDLSWFDHSSSLSHDKYSTTGEVSKILPEDDDSSSDDSSMLKNISNLIGNYSHPIDESVDTSKSVNDLLELEDCSSASDDDQLIKAVSKLQISNDAMGSKTPTYSKDLSHLGDSSSLNLDAYAIAGKPLSGAREEDNYPSGDEYLSNYKTSLIGNENVPDSRFSKELLWLDDSSSLPFEKYSATGKSSKDLPDDDNTVSGDGYLSNDKTSLFDDKNGKSSKDLSWLDDSSSLPFDKYSATGKSSKDLPDDDNTISGDEYLSNDKTSLFDDKNGKSSKDLSWLDDSSSLPFDKYSATGESSNDLLDDDYTVSGDSVDMEEKSKKMTDDGVNYGMYSATSRSDESDIQGVSLDNFVAKGKSADDLLALDDCNSASNGDSSEEDDGDDQSISSDSDDNVFVNHFSTSSTTHKSKSSSKTYTFYKTSHVIGVANENPSKASTGRKFDKKDLFGKKNALKDDTVTPELDSFATSGVDDHLRVGMDNAPSHENDFLQLEDAPATKAASKSIKPLW